MTEAPRKETAEEQLLRLIEGSQSPKTQPVSSTAVATVRMSLRDRLIHGATQAAAALFFRLRLLFSSRQRGDSVLHRLQWASRLLWAVLAMLGLYLVFDIIRFQVSPSRSPSPPTAQPLPSAVSPPPSPETMRKPMAEYLAVMLQRNPFTGTSGSTAAVPIKQARERLRELTADLVVVGIDRGAKPEALIEDKAQNRTYFVKVGDVVNGAFVKEISARGVILEFNGEEELLQ